MADVLAVLAETAKTSPIVGKHRLAIVKHARPLWKRLFDRYLNGPTLEVVVRDSLGKPVSATVELVEIPNHNRENWTSRCDDGFYGHILAKPGRFTLVVSTPGHKLVVHSVMVPAKRVRVQITLPYTVKTGGACPAIPGQRLAHPQLPGSNGTRTKTTE